MNGRTVRLGLISDTHIPQRWEHLPESVSRIFADVDLILHAGDVGELWVLDELGRIAPVVAVHGNDETDEIVDALPFLQTLGVVGRRVVLTHSHHRDPEREKAARQGDSWGPKLDERSETASRHGADILVYGHTHVPMVKLHMGVWLINPGAIASPSWYTRQTVQTVALLTLETSAAPVVRHFNLNEADETFDARVDWDAGFRATAERYAAPIFEPELLSAAGWLRTEIAPIAPQSVLDALLELPRECWAGRRTVVTAGDIVTALSTHPDTPEAVLAKLREFPVFARSV